MGSKSWRSDDLEVACELPVRNVFAELALFPFARRGVVVDERVAEQRASRLRTLKALGGFPERRGQAEIGIRRHRIGVAGDALGRLGLVLDPPEAAAKRGGKRDIGVRVSGGDAVFDPLRARRA